MRDPVKCLAKVQFSMYFAILCAKGRMEGGLAWFILSEPIVTLGDHCFPFKACPQTISFTIHLEIALEIVIKPTGL